MAATAAPTPAAAGLRRLVVVRRRKEHSPRTIPEQQPLDDGGVARTHAIAPPPKKSESHHTIMTGHNITTAMSFCQSGDEIILYVTYERQSSFFLPGLAIVFFYCLLDSVQQVVTYETSLHIPFSLLTSILNQS